MASSRAEEGELGEGDGVGGPLNSASYSSAVYGQQPIQYSLGGAGGDVFVQEWEVDAEDVAMGPCPVSPLGDK